MAAVLRLYQIRYLVTYILLRNTADGGCSETISKLFSPVNINVEKHR